jgi:hypothetical protein
MHVLAMHVLAMHVLAMHVLAMHVLARCVLADGHNPQYPKILGDRLPVVITNNQHGEVILAVFAQCDGCSSHRRRPNQPPNDYPISCPSHQLSLAGPRQLGLLHARQRASTKSLDKEHQTYHELGRCPISAAFSLPLSCDPLAVAVSQRSLTRDPQSTIPPSRRSPTINYPRSTQRAL